MKKNPIDAIIEWFSPQRAIQRAVARHSLTEVRGYDAAKKCREWSSTYDAGPAAVGDSAARATLINRARELERNSDIVEAAITALVRNVVGTGIRPQARTRLKNGDYNETINKQLEELWNQWAKECDITGRQTFYELQGALYRREKVDGDILVQLITDESAKVPLKLQMIEADTLGCAEQTYEGRQIVDGVEIDAYGKPVAYWVQIPDLLNATVPIPKRIPAEQIIHLFERTRPSQVRGITAFARVMRRIKELGEYLDAELLSAKIRSCLSLIVTTNDPNQIRTPAALRNGAQAQVTDSYGNPVEFIERGAIQFLTPGSQITTVSPNQNPSVMKDFTEVETRLIGAALGMSYEIISRDMSQSTYSSARQGHLEDRRTFREGQAHLIEHFCKPVWREFIKACVLKGLVNLPWEQTEIDAEWVAQGWDWIDPEKDVNATKEELKSGIKTFQQICSEAGLDWQTQIDNMSAVQDYANSKGVTLDFLVPEQPLGGDTQGAKGSADG